MIRFFKRYCKRGDTHTTEISCEEAIVRREKLEGIMRFPAIELTQEKFNEIPNADDFTIEWLRNEAPFGFKFICRRADWIPDEYVVLGELVKTGDILTEQYGSGMSPPEKFINRYRIKIVEAVES